MRRSPAETIKSEVLGEPFATMELGRAGEEYTINAIKKALYQSIIDV